MFRIKWEIKENEENRGEVLFKEIKVGDFLRIEEICCVFFI